MRSVPFKVLYLSNLISTSFHSYICVTAPFANVTGLKELFFVTYSLFLFINVLDTIVTVLPVSNNAYIGISKIFISM